MIVGILNYFQDQYRRFTDNKSSTIYVFWSFYEDTNRKNRMYQQYFVSPILITPKYIRHLISTTPHFTVHFKHPTPPRLGAGGCSLLEKPWESCCDPSPHGLHVSPNRVYELWGGREALFSLVHGWWTLACSCQSSGLSRWRGPCSGVERVLGSKGLGSQVLCVLVAAGIQRV